MADATVPSLLVDTSTLLRLGLDRFSPGRHTSAREAAALECLVLFDRVLLDGPTVRANGERLLWTTEIDPGIQVLDLDQQAVSHLYRRGAELLEQMSPGPLGDILPGGHTPSELSAEFPGVHFWPSTSWDDVLHGLGSRLETHAVVHAFADALGPQQPMSGHGPLLLIRLFYYLALQESAGSALLLDPSKAYHDETPAYGYASRILSVFSEQVRAGYLRRKEKWLGIPRPSVPTPLLAQYVKATAERRGWSMGRVVAWLREQPEVHSFRAGMAALLDAAERGDAQRTDAIMAELEQAAAQWSTRLGAPVNRRTIPVTVALPFVESEVNVPIPKLVRSPGSKLLVFINMLLRNDNQPVG